MFFFKLALLNLFRRYGRTTLSLVSVIVGVMVIIVGRGTIQGIEENMIRAQIDGASGHVMAMPAGYPTTGINHPVDELLKLDEQTLNWLNDNTKGWTQRLLFSPKLVSGMDALRVRAIGYNPQQEADVFPREGWSVDGLIPQEASQGIMVSRSIARVLDLKVGDQVVLEVRTSAGAINALQVLVGGFLHSGTVSLDGMTIMVPMPLARDLVQSGEGYSHLALRLNSRVAAAQTAQEMERLLGNQAQVTTWEIEVTPLLETQKIRQVMFDIIALALLVMAAAGIANTVLMAAYERTREIGTLRAMGLTKSGLIRLFVVEGGVMGLVGSILGALLGGGIVLKFSKDGIDMLAAFGDSANDLYQDIPMSAVLYMEFSWVPIAWAIVFGICVAIVSSIYPAVIASRLTPAEAVRS